MTNNYTSIKAMKNEFQNLEIADPTTGELVSMYDFMIEHRLTVSDFCMFLRGKYKRLTSFANKVAFITILSLGTFSDDEIYTTFYLPSTADCMAAYKKIEKKLKRKQRFTVTFSLGNNSSDYNDTYEIAVDLFSAKPIWCKYYDTEGFQCIERY